MKLKAPRKYNMSVRAKTAALTESKILKAVAELWLKYSIHEITLEMIASNAGVTERTILRKFGSKEGLYEAAIKQDVADIQSIRDETETGNIEHAIQTLMKEYELTGMAVVRTLAIEQELPIAAKILKNGRQFHRSWCERVFAPYLPHKKHKNYNVLIGAIYVATDVNSWKLLRKDLGYSEKDTISILKIIIESIVQSIKIQS